MKGRARRTLREADRTIEVYLLDLRLGLTQDLLALDASCKDCRIMLERLALSAAYLRGEPLINEHGFPPASPEDPSCDHCAITR